MIDDSPSDTAADTVLRWQRCARTCTAGLARAGDSLNKLPVARSRHGVRCKR